MPALPLDVRDTIQISPRFAMSSMLPTSDPVTTAVMVSIITTIMMFILIFIVKWLKRRFM
ncbi:unnamed protein product [Periconia digitata]|uniref:Uncharacterized protein n=1 Tax=Periconia digitata TaxID=1303443 RepID=A0A9W4UPV7_9PLEO|nr:unnamed protein product [Periconia digitata]